MTREIVDVEELLKPFLEAEFVAQSITAEVDLQIFGEKSPARAVMIRRIDTPSQELDRPIDTARVMIVARDTNPLAGKLLAHAVIDFLHGVTPQTIGTGPTTNFLLSAALDSGPEREDDEQLRLFQFVMIFDLRVRIDQT